MQSLQQHIRCGASSSRSQFLPWMGPIGLAVGVGVAYFFAAQLSLTLLTKPDGVAVFWPAAGIASGTLLAPGSSARLPVTLGVAAASTVASLLGDRSVAAAIVFALCNVGDPYWSRGWSNAASATTSGWKVSAAYSASLSRLVSGRRSLEVWRL